MFCPSHTVKRLVTMGALLFAPIVLADLPDARHGSIPDGRRILSFEGGLTTTWQHTEDGAEDELLASLDLVATLPQGDGVWTLYVEGCVTPSAEGVSSFHPVVNADAGTALDAEGEGRLQVSELHYTHPVGDGSVSVGLLNPAVFLDASEVANDETRQFLAAPLVNNPTIGFPDYAPGVAYHYDASGWSPGVTVLLTESAGLAGNGGSYAKLFSFSEAERGLFLATELYWQPASATLRLGGWSRVIPGSEKESGEGEKQGVYGLAEGWLGRLHWSLRGGIAGQRGLTEASFVSAAGELPFNLAALGVGVARNLSGKEGDFVEQAECYVRTILGDTLQFTVDLQWLQPAEGGGEPSAGLMVAGFRMALIF